MISETVVELSRWQFAITAMLQALFLPLTLGLSLMLAVMESAFVVTGQVIYKAMAQFWGRIFAINFVLAAATWLVVICQFGMNSSYFSHYVGDVFALPLAMGTLSGFFLAASLFGPYWFGWDRLNKWQHLLVAWLIALAVNVAAYWILVGAGWMQNPLAAAFNFQSYRMELTDAEQLFKNPAALAKYLHTTAASLVTAAATLMAISAYWLRKNQHDQLARRSFHWAAIVGVLAIAMTVWLGDDTPRLEHPVQQAKQAVLRADIGADFLPDMEARIRGGIHAYALLQDLRDDNKDPQLLADFERRRADLGYALLLMPWHKAILNATDQQISLAAQSALPVHPHLLRWSYLFMLASGGVIVLWFAWAAFSSSTAKALPDRLIGLSVYLHPIPWLAYIGGWFVAEAGKQPWAVAGVLPTFTSVSSLSVEELSISLLGSASAYAMLLGGGLYLMRRAVMNRNHSKLGA